MIFFHRGMKNFNGIIGSTSARFAFITNKTRIPEAPDINVKTLIKIIAPKFAGKLADAINSYWFYNSLLRAVYFRRGGSKYGDAAWPVYFMHIFIFSNFQHVQKACHVQTPRKVWIFFSGGRKNCSE